MTIAGKQSVAEIYQLKISLLEINSVIWRRFLVSENTMLFKLHRTIQAGFDWLNYHLHQFIVDDIQYSLPELELEEWKAAVRNEKRFRLNQLISIKAKSFFTNIISATVDDTKFYWKKNCRPKTTSGIRKASTASVRVRRKMSGGVSGYEYFLEAINNPKHP